MSALEKLLIKYQTNANFKLTFALICETDG